MILGSIRYEKVGNSKHETLRFNKLNVVYRFTELSSYTKCVQLT